MYYFPLLEYSLRFAILGSPPVEESQFKPSIKLNLKSRAGRAGKNGFGRRGGAFRKKKKAFNKM